VISGTASKYRGRAIILFINAAPLALLNLLDRALNLTVLWAILAIGFGIVSFAFRDVKGSALFFPISVCYSGCVRFVAASFAMPNMGLIRCGAWVAVVIIGLVLANRRFDQAIVALSILCTTCVLA